MTSSIFDIAPAAAQTVTIRGTPLELQPLGNKEMMDVMRRFPSLRKLINGGQRDDAASALEAMPALIAAALGQCGDGSVEAAIAERLSFAEQGQIFGIVMGTSMPEGDKPAPLVEPVAGDPV